MSDDKTRVLTAEEAARLKAEVQGGSNRGSGSVGGRTATAPRIVGDKIEFFCSKGHRLRVGLDLAGKRGFCDKQGCGVPVVIPFPPGAAAAPAEGVPPHAPSPEAPGDFGFNFEAPSPSSSAEGASTPAEAEAEQAPWSFATDAASAAAEPLPDFGTGAASPPDISSRFDPDDIDHPTARLLARLWMEKERDSGVVIEVHLSGGSVIMPGWYYPWWSCGTHALFAAKSTDQQSHTVTAVAWDQIQRVVVRQVQGDPEQLFGA